MRVASRRRLLRSRAVGLTMLVASVVVGGQASCNLVPRPLPAGAELFAPPAVYAHWWAMTEACSGRSADLGTVHWYRVPGSQFKLGEQFVGGYWSKYANRIVIAKQSIEQGPMVRHEMLHALLQTGKHPRSQFLGACASLVACQGICAKTPGPSHPAQEAYVLLPPESLDVASRGELLPPESDGQRWLSLAVTVRNPREHAVLVAAPDDAVSSPTFGYDLRGPSGGIEGGEVASDSSTLRFMPLETKKWLFEFRVTSDLSEYHIPPGTYLVRGGYARRWTAYDTIAVSP